MRPASHTKKMPLIAPSTAPNAMDIPDEDRDSAGRALPR